MRLIDDLRRMMGDADSAAQSMREAVAGVANQTDLLNRKLAEIVDGLDRQSDLLNRKLTEIVVGLDHQSDLLNRKLDQLIEAVVARPRQPSEGSVAGARQGPSAARVSPTGAAETVRGAKRPLAALVDTAAPACDAALVTAPLVSLVLVAYRTEDFAAAAVRAALAQTYSPLDIIIVDDGSPDATADVISAELAQHSERTDIRFIRHSENLGAFAAWRSSLSFARGEFIVCSAGDDVMLPGMVERMVRVWQREDVSLVSANVRYIDAAGNELNRFYKDPEGFHDDSFETLARDGVNATCFGAAMGFERALYQEFGFPPEYLSAPDIMLPFYAYLRKGARFVAEPLLKYRVRDGNTSLSLQAERSPEIDRLAIEAEIFYVHLAHSLLMTEELERFDARDPVRAAEIASRIKPLLAAQTTETARKLVATRIALSKLGVARLTAPRIPSAAS
jgi:hypothetical protein